MEDTFVMVNTGQPVISVVVRIPNASEPAMIIRIPVGLYLPGGLSIQVDEGKPLPVPLQTCDLQGCYAETPLNTNVLAALKRGKQLSITFQNLSKDSVVLPMPLDNFADALQKIQ